MSLLSLKHSKDLHVKGRIMGMWTFPSNMASFVIAIPHFLAPISVFVVLCYYSKIPETKWKKYFFLASVPVIESILAEAWRRWAREESHKVMFSTHSENREVGH